METIANYYKSCNGCSHILNVDVKLIFLLICRILKGNIFTTLEAKYFIGLKNLKFL